MSFVWKRPEGRLKSDVQCAAENLEVSRELGLDDFAAVLVTMAEAQESDFWCPWNKKDPTSKNYAFDSESDDGRSVGHLQQQNKVPGENPTGPGENWWGSMASRMDHKSSVRMFLSRLPKDYLSAKSGPAAASEMISRVQSPDPDLRQAYAKHWARAQALISGAQGVPVPPTPVGYGMPTGANSGGYGGGGVKFPDWVYQLGDAFGLKPSTYPGHQESDRNEAGYAPNPQHLNRGIDWAAPGAPDEVARMQRFAEYLMFMRGQLEQVIWWNPNTGQRIGVAGGNDVTTTPYYDYPGGYDDHRDHVHTRQSHPIPIPAGQITPPATKPQFDERQLLGNGWSDRTRKPVNFLLHTQQAKGDALGLARYCDGSNNVSYHFTLKDRILYDVVTTDKASWSVLSANVFTINLCFAGSFAEWTREQWLAIEGDIEIAAYIAVRECLKWGIPTDVIAPPYHEAAGISDHKYVTQQLHIGDHTDVGGQFPWDVFAGYVNKYANAGQGDDELSVEAEALIRSMSAKVDEMYGEYSARRQGGPTRSFFGPDAKPVDSPLGFLWNIDGNVWNQEVTWAYLFGVKQAEDLVHSVAANGVVPTSWAGQLTDEQGHWLAEWGQQWCIGLISFRGAVIKALAAVNGGTLAAAATQVAGVDPGLTAADFQSMIDRMSAGLSQQIESLAARPQPAVVMPPAPVPATVELVAQPAVPDGPPTLGGTVKTVVDAVEQLNLGDALSAKEYATLDASIKILQMKNGSQ